MKGVNGSGKERCWDRIEQIPVKMMEFEGGE